MMTITLSPGCSTKTPTDNYLHFPARRPFTVVTVVEYLRARVGYVEFLAKMTFSHHLIASKELCPTVKLDFSKYELN